MDLKKYSQFEKKVENVSFEEKNSLLDKSLNIVSYIGNIGSIFFAFFLLQPALYTAISTYIAGGMLLAILPTAITILILGIFELIKRLVLSNLFFDLIKNKKVILKRFLGNIIISILFIACSFYFSLNGAKNFASNNKEEVKLEQISYQSEIDSVKWLYENKKETYVTDNQKLRKANNNYRDKIIETPLNYRTVRKEYQALIDKNLEVIEENNKELDIIEEEKKSEVVKIVTKEEKSNQQRNNETNSSIVLFLIISSTIEILIIGGVYFRKYYEYNVFIENKPKLSEIAKRKERYITLIKFIYKDGSLSEGKQIVPQYKLIELIQEKTNISSPKKFIMNFFQDMEYLGIFEMRSKRRFTKVNYTTALDKMNNFDDVMRILENLN